MIFRIQKTKYYTIMSNIHLRDKRLSLQAKGLLSLILSFPDEINFYQYEIENFTSNKETAITNSLNELIKYGYVSKTKIRDENGRFNTIYDVTEAPTPDLISQSGKTGSAIINKVNNYNKKTNNKKQAIEPDWLQEYREHFEESIDNL